MDGYRQGLLDYAEYIRKAKAIKDAEVEEIRRRYAAGESIYKLAREYNRSMTWIQNRMIKPYNGKEG